MLFGWLRCGLFLAGAIAAIVALVLGLEWLAGKATLGPFLLTLALAPTFFYLFYASYRFTHATPRRALELAMKAGLDPNLVVEYFAAVGIESGVLDVELVEPDQ